MDVRTPRAVVALVCLNLVALAVLSQDAGAAEASSQEQAPSNSASAPPDLPRLELRPNAGWAIVERSVTGGFVGANVTYRWRPHWAIGLDGVLFSPFDASPATPSYPLNESEWAANLDLQYLPWLAQRETGTFDGFVLLGAGLVRTRPVPVLDPANRHFDYNNLLQLAGGVGARVYLGAAFAITLELRDMLYFDKRESARVATGSPNLPTSDPNSPQNPDLWYSPATTLTNCVELRLGVSFFVGG
jgi:hypothetical protein